jgi:hypothetical protein
MNRRRLLAAIPLLLTVACASIVVRKVPKDGDDTITGFRYYLPRPYVAVTTEFPYDSDDFYGSGNLSEDGLLITVDAVTAKRLDAPVVSSTEALHAVPSTGLSGDTGTSATATAATASDGGTDGGKSSAGAADGGSSGDGGATQASFGGTSNGLVVIPNSPFDIIYMPDFEQQYAIDIQGRFSDSELKVALSNGWMLESVDENLQNGAFGQFLMNQAGKALDVLRGAASLAAGLPSGGTSLSGASVALHIRQVHYVVPGVYPVLKPSEFSACETRICSGGIVPFHLRTERYIEVIRPGGAGGPALSPLVRKMTKLLVNAGVAVTVSDAEPVNGITTVTITPANPNATAAEKTKLEQQAKKALEADPEFKGKLALKWAP